MHLHAWQHRTCCVSLCEWLCESLSLMQVSEKLNKIAQLKSNNEVRECTSDLYEKGVVLRAKGAGVILEAQIALGHHKNGTARTIHMKQARQQFAKTCCGVPAENVVHPVLLAYCNKLCGADEKQKAPRVQRGVPRDVA